MDALVSQFVVEFTMRAEEKASYLRRFFAGKEITEQGDLSPEEYIRGLESRYYQGESTLETIISWANEVLNGGRTEAGHMVYQGACSLEKVVTIEPETPCCAVHFDDPAYDWSGWNVTITALKSPSGHKVDCERTDLPLPCRECGAP